MKKRSSLAIAALIGLSGFAVIGSEPGFINGIFGSIKENPITKAFSSKRSAGIEETSSSSLEPMAPLIGTAPAPKEATTTIPDYVLYDTLFRLDFQWRAKAREQEIAGQPVTAFEHYFKTEANLTDSAETILKQVAQNFVEEVKSIDTQAAAISDGKKDDPDITIETLQQQRNALALAHRDNLASLLGATVFEQFDEYVGGTFALRLQGYEV